MEAVVLCLDNSEYSRNSDYSPNRFIAQKQAINELINTKTNQNINTVCSILSLAGERITTHVTLTRDMGKLMNTMAEESKLGGYADFIGGIKTAQLILKHRQNKNLAPRIILFVGSPVETSQRELVKLAKGLKKVGIAVDVINFGQENTENKNIEKLEAFIKAVNSDDTSHLVSIKPTGFLSDMVASSPVVLGAAAAGRPNNTPSANPTPASNPNDMFGGVDPNTDPELAHALRMSMEEERARQERATQAALQQSQQQTQAPMEIVKEEELQDDDDESDDEEDDDEEAMMAAALAMSMATGDDDGPPALTEAAEKKGDDDDEDLANVLKDPDFINELLENAGVDSSNVDDLLQDDDDDEDEDD